MTPKQKAQEIFNKFYFAQDKDGYHSMSEYRARECAYIALDEILDFMILNLGWKENGNGNVDFWMEVKNEIQKIST